MLLEIFKDKNGDPLYTIEVDDNLKIIKAEMYNDQTLNFMDVTEHIKDNIKYFIEAIQDEYNKQLELRNKGSFSAKEYFNRIFGGK